MFNLVSNYKPSGDQPQAIDKLVAGIENGMHAQTLLGVTGSGKTFTMANVIQRLGRPTLVLAHNKTLAGQLYAEFKELFPDNAVEYFISYYDYYQPEAYIASTDTYIEKDSSVNDEIDRMRHEATKSLLTREDTIVVASVSCIYGIGEKSDYLSLMMMLEVGLEIPRDAVVGQLISMQYERNDFELKRGTFRCKGDVLDIWTPDSEHVITRVSFFGDEIEKISFIDSITGRFEYSKSYVEIFPASHYATGRSKLNSAIERIEDELDGRIAYLRQKGETVAAYRLEQRTRYDMDMMRETGFCKGIENYSRHISGRSEGEPPCTLMDFFPDDFLLFIDESHQTLPQVRAMYNGDHARKDMLVQYGFRLPSAYDNRPLKFEEFESKMGSTVFVSATPAEYETTHSDCIVEQMIRPTGLLEPEIDIRPVEGQIEDILGELQEQKKRGDKSLIMTLTKRMAEDLTEFLTKEGVRVTYIHSDIKAVERMQILNRLRNDEIDVIVGINLLREGIDLPEVSLLMILDADKEGFLRSERSLIQIIGRCARNEHGRVILYADEITDSMMNAVSETNRRREIQRRFNQEHGIVPKTIKKAVRDVFDIVAQSASSSSDRKGSASSSGRKGSRTSSKGDTIDPVRLINEGVTGGSEEDKNRMIDKLSHEMEVAAKALDFEKAAEIRDIIIELKGIKS
ncbi:MAG: excinuclease ABC subunit UvrB [Saccharofermentans sp.]|jgi:excinuclease ABC subunit B|nr:excinuclease ABC subunit UvrB [Mageeibacillus sp.]MCI1263852.1 excinuclease ABC subunit UvrB [Saccharofermentans sp.]MCI1275354.1 excinuclease ABC subunit UvrB [Saccharofermentans sp.]MCI1769732.1 excinuclease ABC subunit UvrB [Mageeibacillus sp.]MCI2043798.1 excinuclease ABC subunit UvrB [Mageeibacillus sp.]